MSAPINVKSSHPLAEYIDRFLNGQALLPNSPTNVQEVVGILDSYGVVLDAYSKNLIYIADHQFLVFFPFFKYFNGEISPQKLLKHWWNDRINYEYAEYCMKGMFWHGGGGLDAYLDTPAFATQARKAIEARLGANIVLRLLDQAFPDFMVEHVRQMAYYSGLGQFWRVMSDMFLGLRDAYAAGKIQSIPDVVDFIKAGLVQDAGRPITYAPWVRGKRYDLLPQTAGLTFLMDTAVPYVEAIFFRGTPFPGTVSYNAQAFQIPSEQSQFQYGALYADPLPIGGSGIPPTQLMQDMRHFLPDYLQEIYQSRGRGLENVRVQICQSFQKSMFCVTSAAILGLAPHPLDTQDEAEQRANIKYFEGWMSRLATSRLPVVQST
ncbi:CO2 hydration protein [Lyngbya confervoides]|uniref:CO2 hydration protein n=1 Tax=Lyngbya confervoides BDU141951 TaxID=1574623 RepID=A0ABD4T3Q6_9CYAN|nr:CO2 hydration protein [Lyngbya confervoides]MCM1983051.1 CO2 hydration protein [Lyngbya confervoides BDU141951]